MAELPDAIARINALTTNARNTWFALLGVLVFVSITLMGVEHIDFYGVGRTTKLPLVDVEVPTRDFFIAAPVLTAAIYGYFHLYLIRLWDALARAPARVNGQRLGDVISPWLVSDAALYWRQWMCGDNCVRPRSMEAAAMLLNLALAWGFGLLIALQIWWKSLPARDLLLTGIAAAFLLITLCIGTASLIMMHRRMAIVGLNTSALWKRKSFTGPLLMISLLGLTHSWLRVAGPAYYLADISLVSEDLVERPADWLPREFAEKEFRAHWCKREGFKPCSDFGDWEKEYAYEWQARRTNAIAALRTPGFNPVSLNEAQNAAGFNVHGFSNVFLVIFQKLSLSAPNLQNADMRNAFLSGINLTTVRLQQADLSGAQMEGAILLGAQLQGANLFRAQLQGADLSYSLLTGTDKKSNTLDTSNLSASINDGSALRFVDLRKSLFDGNTDFRNTFLDGSVSMPVNFAIQMRRPCQWWPEPIKTDEEFYGRWRGWVEHPSNPYSIGWADSIDLVDFRPT